jgi:hypothetical protein
MITMSRFQRTYPSARRAFLVFTALIEAADGALARATRPPIVTDQFMKLFSFQNAIKATMICPKFARQMLETTFCRNMFAHQCTVCEGLWFDLGEAKRLKS